MSYNTKPLEDGEFRLSLVHLEAGSDRPLEIHFEFPDVSRDAVLALMKRALPSGMNTNLGETE